MVDYSTLSVAGKMQEASLFLYTQDKQLHAQACSIQLGHWALCYKGSRTFC